MAALCIMALAGLPSSPAEAGGDIPSGSPIDLDLVDANLQELLATFSEITDFVFAMDARTAETGVLDSRISAGYESTPWDRVLDDILSEADLEWTLEGKVLWIHLPDSAPAGDRNFTGDPINLRLEDAKLVDVLGTMSNVTGHELVFDPAVDATVSVRLQEIPWDQVLDLVLRVSGFDSAHKGDTLEVFRVSDAKGMQFGVASSTHSTNHQ
jgi:type II secretory pathway component HofQ